MSNTLTKRALRAAKTFTVAALAVATIGLAAPPPASAARKSCSTAMAIAQSYIAAGNVFYGLGDSQNASYWYGRAEGIIAGAC